MYYYRLQINWVSLTKKIYIVVTLCDSCEVRTEFRFHFVVVTLRDSYEVRTESRFHFVVVMLRDSCEVRTESRFNFVMVTLCDSREVRTESRFHFVVLLSTLLYAILHPSHHLLNVLLQIANKLGHSNKQTKINEELEVTVIDGILAIIHHPVLYLKVLRLNDKTISCVIFCFLSICSCLHVERGPSHQGKNTECI
jgi:hypothetical protein